MIYIYIYIKQKLLKNIKQKFIEEGCKSHLLDKYILTVEKLERN